ncbi:monooxygenase [Cryphonectria parasitica EP155]|uniref:Monooxygenase n=1 Tax=Cryphonectria parasitica (strain ATCC 38755 / EP155) TaxID=660469 RepID=A0A9P5CT56_CRYP1|nr:monooxygenase [Cryphonectria parasitica EP155]KAF3769322.1 monooxygenase [Cryphonectria parasitica EP155]
MSKFPRLPDSGIKVIIVGAGFAGLTAAIECDRKGHNVTLFEKIADLKPLGDIISFGQNATRIFARWPGVMEKFQPLIHKSQEISYHSWEGKYVTTQSWLAEKEWGPRVNGHRGELHRILYEHAKERGIEIRLGQDVTDYFESETEAGVVVNGEKHVADVVLAAEGVKSRGRRIVLGFDDKPQPSGYAIYRAWYPTENTLRKKAVTQHLVMADTHNAWIGQDIHFIAAAVKNGGEMSWVCTHKDEAGIEENWQFPGKVEDVLKVLQGWAPEVVELVKATPPDRLFDYKLVYRDPLPTFISPEKRIALIGDAAHPFLPTSIQGASQAMEDGVVLAACLAIAGKARVTEAMQVYEKIRYERVHKIQATGVSTREMWHKADWDAIWKDPSMLHLKREEWILRFDAEEDAYSRYDEVKASLQAV